MNDKNIIIIAVVIAILYEITVFVRDFLRERDIRKGVDAKTATRYYKKLFHKENVKEAYYEKLGKEVPKKEHRTMKEKANSVPTITDLPEDTEYDSSYMGCRDDEE